MVIHWFKKLSIPSLWVSNAIYFIPSSDGQTVNQYITDGDGVPKPVGSTNSSSDVVGPNTEVLLVQADMPALLVDSAKYIFLDGSIRPVTYTINPAAMNMKTFRIKCIDATHPVKVVPLTGSINGASELEFGENDSVAIYAYSTKLVTVP